jgi:hypothetical protein
MHTINETKASANQLIQPVGELVQRRDIDDMVKRLKSVLEIPGDSVRFAGELSVYNPLLELASNDSTAFRAVVRLIMRKRANRNLPYTSLKALLNGETDIERAIWQEEQREIAAEANRGYVAAMRERLRRLVKIENMLRPPHAQLTGQARLDFTSKMWSQWAQRRLAALEAAQATKPDGRLTRKEAREVVEAFRLTIDRELDAMEEKAKRRQLHAH